MPFSHVLRRFGFLEFAILNFLKFKFIMLAAVSKNRHAGQMALFYDFSQSAVKILSVVDGYLRVVVNYFLKLRR